MMLHEMKIGKNLHILMKGKWGTRKTTAALSFPGPILIIDFDRKVESVKLWVDRQDITVWQFGIDDYEEFKAKFEPLQENCPYRTVIIDSLTTMAQLMMEYSINKSRDKLKKDRKIGRMIGVLEMPDQADYGGEARGLTTSLNILNILPCHVILIAHVIEWEEKDPADQTRTRTNQRLTTGGKTVAAQIPVQFGEIWHFEVGGGVQGGNKFRIITQSMDKDFARTGLGLPAVIEFGDEKLWPIIVQKAKLKGIDLEEKEISKGSEPASDTKKGIQG